MTELIPRSIYQNISNVYIDVYGSNFRNDCVCLFGEVESPHSIYLLDNHLKCLVPSMQIKDRSIINRTIKGYNTRLSLNCPKTFKRSHEHLSLFIKYGTQIRNLSRSYIRENQVEADHSITLRG